MSKIRGKRTRPEILFHNLLKGNRVKHEMWPGMFGNPDVLLKDFKVVIFINGCFWHGCRRHFRAPKSNRKFWAEKIERNVLRQKLAIGKLRKMGFAVVVLWEHDLRFADKKAVKTP
ncbi:MAG: very short patch repair endonuclease [Candidatus Nealsonbacteria bacterium]